MTFSVTTASGHSKSATTTISGRGRIACFGYIAPALAQRSPPSRSSTS
jgi:hypothetical protein